MDDLISRQAAIELIERMKPYHQDADDIAEMIANMPSTQPEPHDLVSRQAAISAICNACGKIDCDKMDKCEKLQLPPASCSEFPNSSDTDTISRQAAIDIEEITFGPAGEEDNDLWEPKEGGNHDEG